MSQSINFKSSSHRQHMLMISLIWNNPKTLFISTRYLTNIYKNICTEQPRYYKVATRTSPRHLINFLFLTSAAVLIMKNNQMKRILHICYLMGFSSIRLRLENVWDGTTLNSEHIRCASKMSLPSTGVSPKTNCTTFTRDQLFRTNTLNYLRWWNGHPQCFLMIHHFHCRCTMI